MMLRPKENNMLNDIRQNFRKEVREQNPSASGSDNLERIRAKTRQLALPGQYPL
jgi:hypothetical protein